MDAIKREESAGNPLKQMLKAIDIPKHQLNESSIDLPIVPNKVLKHANRFHTPTDHEVSPFSCGCWQHSRHDRDCLWSCEQHSFQGCHRLNSACCRPHHAVILELKA